jgi:hypothetical protein
MCRNSKKLVYLLWKLTIVEFTLICLEILEKGIYLV